MSGSLRATCICSFVFHFLSVASSDIALCVLSFPDVLSGLIDPKILSLITPQTLILLNKLDLAAGPSPISTAQMPSEMQWRASLNSGLGLESFLEGFSKVLKERFDISSGEEPIVTQARHRTHLETALEHLQAFTAMGTRSQ